MIDTLVFWAFALTVCAFALLVHSLVLMRKLVYAQQLSAWRMGIVVLSALVSIWSLFVAFGAFATVPNFANFFPPHFTFEYFMQFKASIDMAMVSCQVQTAIVAIVFLVSVFLERGTFPVVQRAPQWVSMRERRPFR